MCAILSRFVTVFCMVMAASRGIVNSAITSIDSTVRKREYIGM